MADRIPGIRGRWSPLPLADVTIDDGFFAPRRELIRTVTLRQQEHQLRTGGQFEALRLGWQPGDGSVPHIFWESDVAKWIEAASYSLARTPDPELAAAVDEAIGLLAGAQQDDGYLNVYFTLVEPGRRFTDLRDAHELYCAGHLIEAGVAHYQATGSRSLLDVVVRFADLIDREFGPGGSCEGGYDGHEEIELALLRLARVTGERRYRELSRRLVTWRGQQPFYFEAEERRRGTPGYFGSKFPQRAQEAQRFREYNQSHQPVVEQRAVVGHAVRAMYLYSAMAELAAEYDDERLWQACERLWDNLTGRKLYVTGGVGADPDIEGLGGDYELPDAYGYAETCAAIGLVLWAQRMANAAGDARYVDTLELALYNGVLSGASADGTHYFYGNPLASNGSVHRQEWFGVACCPPNLARLVSSLEFYVYSGGVDEAVVNLFVAGSARLILDGVPVTLTQRSDYPRDGRITVDVEPATARNFTVSLRLPAWCTEPALTVNGAAVAVDDVAERGYARLHRRWAPGDRVVLDLPMPPRRIWAHQAVASAAGRVALQRGPLVFCLEGVDHDVPVHTVTLPRDAAVRVEPDPGSGVVALTADGTAQLDPDDPALYRSSPPVPRATRVRAVPYFSWANRGRSDLTVWIRESGP